METPHLVGWWVRGMEEIKIWEKEKLVGKIRGTDQLGDVGFEVLSAASMKVAVFWVVAGR
jgi:hypothetical protein